MTLMLLIALLLIAFPFLCGAVPALPNSAAALSQQQQRQTQLEEAAEKGIDAAGGAPFAFEPSEQKAFVLKGRRVKNLSSPPAVIPKLTADAKIIPSDDGEGEWREMPGQKQQQQPRGRLFPPAADSVVPKMGGGAVGMQRVKRPMAPEDFGGPNSDALTNPAAFFMWGADLDKVSPDAVSAIRPFSYSSLSQIAAPSCHLMGCVGPLANDGDIALEGRTGPGAGGRRQCHQTFVPLNGCWERAAGRDSYPVGMVCTICCDCSAQLTAEMRRSRGWTNGYRIGQW